MKTKFLFLVLLGLVSSLLIVGCAKEESAPTPAAPSTNAPAK